jgi:hypothetical protein
MNSDRVDPDALATPPASLTAQVSRVVGYAYPWDVVGDPAFAARVETLGVREVALAASYHGARAATPLHPLHRLVEAPSSALYRPVRESAWQGHALRPAHASWVASPDPFADAATVLTGQGLAVDAWLILAHSSRLGLQRPDVAVRNCFDDVYSYALCVSHEEVLTYITTLASEAVRDVPISGLSIEGCGQLGVAHNGLHEKTDGAYGPAAQRVLSVCCCSACQKAWLARGLDPLEVVGRLRDALQAVQAAMFSSDAGMPEMLGEKLATELLTTRLASQDIARDQVLQTLREVAPGARVTVHGQADQWATGPSPALTARAAGQVDAVLVPAWNPGAATYEAITAARALAPDSASVAAYVTVLPPADPGTVGAHTDALIAAGADELHLYHLGLATQARLEVLGDLARRYR